MKLRLAAQVFSHYVAAGMSAYIFCQKLLAQTAGPADFIEKWNAFLTLSTHSLNTPKKYRNPLFNTSASRKKLDQVLSSLNM